MNSFGKIKTKILGKLTESFSSKNKKEMKDILKTLKGNNDFKEMYLFYEEIENKYFEDKEIANLYVEQLSDILKTKSGKLKDFCKKLDESLNNVNTEENDLYNILDQLSEEDNLNNLDKKVISKRKLVEHLLSKKNLKESENTKHTYNENLLHAVLANNFNVLYGNSLTESQKEEFKTIMSLSNEDIVTKTGELKESLNDRINNLLSESTETDIIQKLNKVREEVNNKTTSRLNYYRLVELKNGLD